MLRTIEKEGVTYAIIATKEEDKKSGTRFFTPSDLTLQMGIIQHDASYVEPIHYHRPKRRVVTQTYETLQVTRGSVHVDFFKTLESKKPFESVLLKAGDLILLLDGPHRIRTDKGFAGVKVKQGPYISIEEDKVIAE